MKKIIVLIFGMILFICCQKKITEEQKIPKSKVQEKVISVDSTITDNVQVIAPKGNQIFEESEKLRFLRIVNGYILKSINVEECEDSDENLGTPYPDKIVNEIVFEKNSFTVKFSAVENCCSEFLCEAEIINKSTLNIIYQAFGRHCSCNCKFNLEYTFLIDSSLEDIGQKRTKITHIQFNNDPTSKVKFK
ncbi:hypothetical protein [Kordia sp.]|uniref:hypothetical protein n=1 Tax=Kordia sp. TaxID=1965332 RepID=UPI003B5B7538